jgi:hypothetical protein
MFFRMAARVVAAFVRTKPAFDAIAALHVAGLKRTWIGFYGADQGTLGRPVLYSEWEGDPLDAQGIFPMRDGLKCPLSECLRRRGVPVVVADRFERDGSLHGIVVVVDAKARIDDAKSILALWGARLVS